MSYTYDKFLQRLVQYRLKLKLTQAETSKALGITQSQFSKMELGKTIVSYKLLVSLMEMDWDVDYIVTGKAASRERSELSLMLESADDSGKRELLQVIAWAIYQRITKEISNMDLEIQCEAEFLKRFIAGGTLEPVLCEIRRISGVSQIPMSEKLGVNIKKYRMLEREVLRPDAELLLRIYEVTGCKPSLLLDPNHMQSIIIDDLWYRLELSVRNEILSFVDHAIAILRI